MILSTNKRLISVGQDYSAGENIGIYNHTISSRNWSPDITYAAESAYQRATGYTEAQISGLSGEVSDEVSQLGSDIQYISGVALTSHQSLEGYLTKASGDEYYQPIGSYATVSQLESTSGEIVNLIPTDYVSNETLEQTSGNIVNLIPDTSEFITNASAEQTYQPIGNYLSSNALEGYATQDWVQDQGYLTGVSIPESATWQDVSTTVQTNSAQWAEGGGGGDPEVNSFVYDNSATIVDVNTSYQENSGNFLTAAPADMATTGDIAELAQTVSETYQTKGDYLVRSDSANFYPANNPSSFATEDWVTAQGYITGVDLSEYAERDFVLSSIESATIGKLDVSSFASVSSDFLTTSFGISESAHWEEATNAYEQNSGTYLTAVDLTPYATTAEVDTLSSMLSAAIDYVSANAGDEFPASADEAIQYVQTNSANIDETVNEFQTNSSTYMVEPNLEYNSQGYINGYNGSAVATIDQERQWFTHDDTLTHITNSAQYALGVNLPNISADLARMLGIDETVLFETTATNGAGVCNLSESLKNFKIIRVLATRGWPGPATTENSVGGFSGPWSEWETDGISADGHDYNSISPYIYEGYNWKNSVYSADDTFTTLTWYRGVQRNMGSTAAGITADSFTGCVGIKKIIGIGRKN